MKTSDSDQTSETMFSPQDTICKKRDSHTVIHASDHESANSAAKSEAANIQLPRGIPKSPVILDTNP